MKGVSAYILAGGKSSRMGSDKGMLLLNRTTFIEHIIKALREASVENITVVSANTAYDYLDCNRIEDVYPYKGPVGGIFTALSHSNKVSNIVLSVDIPLISADIIKWLVANKDEHTQITQVRVEGKTNPLIAIYNSNLVPVFAAHLKQNQLKLQMLVKDIPHQTIDVAKNWCPLLKNINTVEDYQNLLK